MIKIVLMRRASACHSRTNPRLEFQPSRISSGDSSKRKSVPIFHILLSKVRSYGACAEERPPSARRRAPAPTAAGTGGGRRRSTPNSGPMAMMTP